MATVIKTIKLGIHKEMNPGKRKAILDTLTLYNQAIAFYMDFFVGHLAIFDEKEPYQKKDGVIGERPWNAQEILTFAEIHTLETRAHPHPIWPLIETSPSIRTMPTSLRRAAINHASGKVKSWSSSLKNWEATGENGRRPQLGFPNEPITFYADMIQHPDFDLLARTEVRHTFISVKLWSEDKWQSVALPVVVHDKARVELAQSQIEQARIRTETAKIKAAKATKEPKEPWSDEERARVRPHLWCAQSPSIYIRKDKQYPDNQRFSIHIPMEIWIKTPKKAEVQRATHPDMPVVTVDLGVNRLAVMGAFIDSQLVATKFVRGGELNHHRHQMLAVINRKRQQSGRLQPDVQDNASLWEKIRNLDDNAARQVASQIVEFARVRGAQVIVFEYLRQYRPSKEKMSLSGRKNHKRGYWLRGQIVKWVRDLAFREGILTVERNPAYTSQMCPHCRTLGERKRHRFTCQNPDHVYQADADFVGMMNLYKKWNKTFVYPRKSKKADEPKPVTAAAVAV